MICEYSTPIFIYKLQYPEIQPGFKQTEKVYYHPQLLDFILDLFNGDEVRNQIEVAMMNYGIRKSPCGFDIDYFVVHLRDMAFQSSYPYNYISYGRTEEEMNAIIASTEHIQLELSYTVNSERQCINIAFKNILRQEIMRETPYEQFKKATHLNAKFLIAEMLILKKFNKKIVEHVRRYIDYLNIHRNHTIERLTEEQRNLILKDIQQIKQKIGRVATEFKIELPEDLLRPERIFNILAFMEQVENEVSPNVKRVIQNKDLGRYLMGFI
jgi:hypothetical protein